MHRALLLLLLACGSPPAASSPSNATPATAPPATVLVVRELVDAEGVAHRVWIQPGRESQIETNHPCCGLAYDGNRYDDALASCAARDDDTDCGPRKTGVYPGLADDAICGSRRRCVPLPEVRVVVHDRTMVEGSDAEGNPLGGEPTKHRPVHLGPDGFVDLTIAGRAERVAVDYGSRYTIEVRGNRIARITRD